MKILIVEDEVEYGWLLAKFLREKGYLTEHVASGKSAIEHLESQHYDLILLDLFLPDMNGMELLKRIKETNTNQEVVVITGHGTIKTAVEATKLGAFDFLTKSCSLEEVELVFKKIESMLNLKRENRLLKQEKRLMEEEMIVAKRRRKIVRRDNGKVVEFEEVKYGMLMMVLCDREGKVYDVWITFGSMHEVRAFRERKKRSVWFRELVENCVVYGDRGYRGCEGVIVCDSREMRAKRQVVEGVISQIKLFNAGSGWRTLTCVLVYVYAYAIGYSYYRRGELEV